MSAAQNESGRAPRQSAIKMMETMKAIAPAERRPHGSGGTPRAAAAGASAESKASVHSAPVDTSQPKRKQAAPAPAAEPQPAAIKRRRQQGAPEITVLEWLEAEAEKRPVDHSTPALPQGIDPPERPPAAALLFLHKIRNRIKQPSNGAWTPKQLAQGVTRLFEALPPAHQEQYRSEAKDRLDRYKAELVSLRPVGSKPLEMSSSDQGRGRSPSAFKVYERNVMPRLRHAHPYKSDEELIKLCKKEWAGISDKERRTYQFLAERDRERLRTQELLWREASLGSRQGDGSADGSTRTFHTLIPQFCAFCGHPVVQYIEPKKHCKSCGRAFALELVAFAVGGSDDASTGAGALEEDDLNICDI